MHLLSSTQPPMRESCIDLVSLAMKLHADSLTVVQSGIRTLANMAATLQSLAFATIISENDFFFYSSSIQLSTV